MRVRCTACEHVCDEAGGVSGLTTIVPSTLLTAGLLAWLAPGRGVWVYLAALPVWFALATLFAAIPVWRIRAKYRRRPCPSCGACAWGPPESTGFGL